MEPARSCYIRVSEFKPENLNIKEDHVLSEPQASFLLHTMENGTLEEEMACQDSLSADWKDNRSRPGIQ